MVRSELPTDMARQRIFSSKRKSSEMEDAGNLAIAQARLDRATASMIATRTQVCDHSCIAIESNASARGARR
jgi:multidrug resistance efflux pump